MGAVFVDDEETTITDEAEGIDVGGGDGITAEGLYGVDEEAVESDGHSRGGRVREACALFLSAVEREVVG